MYTISIEFRGSILACHVEGINSVDSVIRYLNDIHLAMETHRCGKVLIIENLAGPGLNMLKMYQIIKTAKKTVLSLPHAIAYIDINPEHTHASLKFAETVALNRFIRMRLFNSQRNATAWLERITL